MLTEAVGAAAPQAARSPTAAILRDTLVPAPPPALDRRPSSVDRRRRSGRGRGTAARRRSVQRTGQLMYELLTTYPVISGLQPEYGWEVPYGETADGLPYIGPHRNYPRHLFALGGRRLIDRRLPRGAPSDATTRRIRRRRATRCSDGRAEPTRSTRVDLLAFGPHPDDIEIGIGGIVARHARLGFRVGLCDLTAGEMGSNGTVEDRLAESEAARRVLGARWRVNLRLPDRGLDTRPEHARAIANLVRAARPRSVAVPYWVDRHPDHVAASQLLTDAVFNAGLAALRGRGRRVEARSGSATTSSTTRRRHRSSSTSATRTRSSDRRSAAIGRSSSPLASRPCRRD